jgi:hypothetical protein
MLARSAIAILLIISTTFCRAQESTAAEHPDFEVAQDLSAADLLPADLLRGEHYVVDDRVRNDGYLNYYTIRSDFGEFETASTAMLKIRIREVEALAELDELSHTEVFVKAMADAGVAQIVSVKTIVLHPVATITGIPRGIGRMFKRYSRQSKDAVAAFKAYVEQRSDDDSDQTEEEKADHLAHAVSLTERYFGITSAERNWAKKLKTDPYTSNEILVKAIKNVARVDTLGRTALAIAGGSIPYIGYVGMVTEAVWGEDPYALRDRNHAALLATGADADLVDEYFNNPWMSPTQQTVLTAAITALENVGGRAGILQQAVTLSDEVEVGYFVRSVALLAWYHQNKEPFESISTKLAIPGGIAAGGKSALLFPSDHVYWTEPMAQAANEYRSTDSDNSGHAQELWILGTTTDRTRRQLLALGYDLHTDFAEMLLPVSDDSEAED